MTEFLQNLFSTLFENNVILATIFISMIPIIELRGGIPFGMATHIWGEHALNYLQSFLFAFLGSSAIVLLLALLIKPLIMWLKKTKIFKKLANWFETKISKKANKITDEEIAGTETKKSKWKKILGVFVFVAIPLPLTGVWTGTCIAIFLGLSYFETISSVILGNLCAGIIMTVISLIFKNNTLYVFYIFLAIAIVLLVIGLIKNLITKNKSKKSDNPAKN